MLRSARCRSLSPALVLVLAFASLAFGQALRAEVHDCFAKSAGAMPAWFIPECAATLKSVKYTPLPVAHGPQAVNNTSFIKENFPAPLNVVTAPLPTLTFTTVGPNARPLFAIAFDNPATTLWGIDNTTREYGTIDQTTGAFTVVGTLSVVPPTDTILGMKFDPTSANVYISASNNTVSTLYTLDLGTGVATVVGPMTGSPFMIDLAIDNSGQMWGHDIGADTLNKIDKATGAVTLVGSTGMNANFAQGMDFDHATGTLYGYAFVIVPAQQGQLVTFDLVTGAATVVAGPVPQEMEGAINNPAIQAASAVPVANEIDAPLSGSATNGNSVFDPDESVQMRPTWMNTSGFTTAFTGALSNFTGPGAGVEATYTINDGTADYGTIPDGGSQQCTDCYNLGLSIVTIRPVQHWDATVDETLTEAALTDGVGIQTTWTLHIGGSFTDVDPLFPADPYYKFIETIFHFGVTAGCGAGDTYCPLQNNLRKEMAVFLLKASLGAGYTPPDCAGIFDDVPCPPTPEFPYSNFIEDLNTRNITAGCQVGPPALFCPEDTVTRAQMAPFLLKTKLGGAYTPPACTGVFDDVPCPPTPEFPFSNFIEDLFTRGITTGCQIGPPALYCPDNAVTRQEMAVFLSLTFDLVLYGPPVI